MEMPPPYVLHPANVNQRPALDLYLLTRKHSSRASRNPQRGKLERLQRSRIEPLLQEVTLRGRYVTLQPLRIEHSPELYPSAREEEIWEFFSMKVKAQEDLTRWIRKRIEEVRNGTAFAVVKRDSMCG